MIDAARVDGCKSLDGVACMERALDRFATRTGAAEPDPKVKRAVQATTRNACADGASEAQLTFRLAKVKLVLPQLDFIARAKEHSASLVMKQATKQCTRLQKLIDALVSGFSSHFANGHVKMPGGFARHVFNSTKFHGQLDRQVAKQYGHTMKMLLRAAGVQDTLPPSGRRDDISEKAVQMSFCMSRFDCIVDPLAAIFDVLRGFVAVLVEEAATGFEPWAKELIDKVVE